jgi:hypothetical protein
MSIVCWVMGVTPAQIATLRATPLLVGSLIKVALDEHFKMRFEELIKRMSPAQIRKFEANQVPPLADAGARSQVASLGVLEPAITLEKSWYMLHYLFTGHVGLGNAPGDLLLTGEELGDDLGYGPVRLHTEMATRDFRHFLDRQQVELLQGRIDLKEMRRLGVYAMPLGSGSDEEYTMELRSDVALFFTLLRDYVRKEADKGNGLLLWFA